jgi:hypothetical protein
VRSSPTRWLHAKDATGQLGGAMNEAKTSMQLVGGLFGSLLRAVGALGEALYPVSKIAVKDLTDGLNALAGIITATRTPSARSSRRRSTGLVGVVKAAFEGVGMLRTTRSATWSATRRASSPRSWLSARR